MLAAASEKSSKPYYLMSSRSGVMNSEQVKALRACGLVQIGGTAGLAAIDRVGRYMMKRRPLIGSRAARSELRDLVAANGRRRVVNEFDAKRILAAHGLPVTRERRAATLAQAHAAAKEIGFPVVLKIISDEIPHKTEFGLVALRLKNEAALAEAFDELTGRVDALGHRPADAAFLIQEFVPDGVEVFAGIARDPDFGLSLAFGMGGTGIEITRDFSLRMLPLREADAEAMIAKTRGAAMLHEHRGGAAADVKGLIACLEGLADFAWQNAELIEEVDLNPIKALPHRCVIVDALIVTKRG
jgi:acyl-CoA synthetase (NDP forming)